VPGLMWLVTGLLVSRPRFIAQLVYVASMVDILAVGQVVTGCLSVLLSVLFHQCSMLINLSVIDTIKSLCEIKFLPICCFSLCTFEAYELPGLDFVAQGIPVFYSNRMEVYN
jgi:hypothetical protein